MTTDHFEFKTANTQAADADHDKWIDVLSIDWGATRASGDHKGWIDVVSVSQPIIRDGDDKHGSVTDWCPILDV